MDTPLVIVLLGPTASGKTDLAIDLAEKLNLSIHNIDSRQIYKGMDIGTAKPNQLQLKRINHHLIDIRDPNHPINLKEFHEEAKTSINKSISIDNVAFLVGGSGLYIKAITEGFIPPSVPPQPLLRNQFNELGQHFCYKLLQSSDPKASLKISCSDTVRTQRALEVIYSTGKQISSLQQKKPPAWNVLEIGLDPKDIRKRIIERTEQIYQNGLIEETKKLINEFGIDLPMLQTIGYKEALAVIKTKLELKEAVKITTIRTQQFAKRQRTWFRRQHNPHWLNDEEPLREAMSLIQSALS